MYSSSLSLLFIEENTFSKLYVDASIGRKNYYEMLSQLEAMVSENFVEFTRHL